MPLEVRGIETEAPEAGEERAKEAAGARKEQQI